MFRIHFQLMHLLLIQLTRRYTDRQDGAEVVAPPLHPALVEVAGLLYSDETSFHENTDAFQHSVFRQTSPCGDGAVAGMALMCTAVLDQQQIGIDHEHRGRKAQQEDLIGEREEFASLTSEHWNTILGDESLVNQTGQMFLHCGRCKVDRFDHSVYGDCFITAAVGVVIAEIRQDHKLNGLELAHPHCVGQRETVVPRIAVGQEDVAFSHLPSHPDMRCTAHSLN